MRILFLINIKRFSNILRIALYFSWFIILFLLHAFFEPINASSRLGHSKIGTTMDLYGHALKSADEAAANQVDQFFTKNKKNQA